MQEYLNGLIIFIPFFMLFGHIVDDFYLQGVLAKLKQKTYWTDDYRYPAKLKQKVDINRYSIDWVPAMLMHCLSWSFMIHLPFILLIGRSAIIFIGVSFIVNALIHFIVDDLKANRYVITLCVDQMIHLLQITATFMVACLLGYIM